MSASLFTGKAAYYCGLAFLVISLIPGVSAATEPLAEACPIVDLEEKQAAQKLESGRTFPQQRQPPAQKCKISLGAVLPLWKQGKTVIVDVRSEGDYAEHHIPDSINIPLLSLSGKSFLKTKNLILVNEGHNDSAMEDACASMKKNGFKNVKVLNGGLLEWIERGHPITGNPSMAVSSLRRISPKDFYAAYMKSEWQVIDLVQENNQEALKNLLPQAEIVSLTDTLNSLKKNSNAAEHGRNSSLRQLAITDDGNGYDHLTQPLIEKRLPGLFYLKGGLKAFQSYLKNHAAMLKRLERGPVKYTKCSIL